MEKETKFVDGIYVEKPSENAPDFVIAKFSIGQKFIEFYEKNKNQKGYVNCDILESREGKYYIKLNTWTPDSSNSPKTAPESKDEGEIDISSISF